MNLSALVAQYFIDSSSLDAQKRRFGRIIYQDPLKKEIFRLKSELHETKRVYSAAYNEDRQFDGIISHLASECGGNVHQKRVVNVTSSGDKQCNCYSIVDDQPRDFWYSTNQENSWVMFDFKDKEVCLDTQLCRLVVVLVGS